MPYEGLVKMTPKGPRWTGKVILDAAKLEQPLSWKKPRRIFVNSMSDLFHEALNETQIQNVFSVMEGAKRHTYQVLTKRPARMLEFVSKFDKWLGYAAATAFAERFSHVWLGVSVEDQKTANERIPILLETPAAVRWISAEPLLGPIDLSAFTGVTPNITGEREVRYSMLDWVVVGGESGPKARPMHPDWARGLRDQCVAAGVPYFFKQHGEWIGSDQQMADGSDPVLSASDVHHKWPNGKPSGPPHFGMNYSIKVGKKAAGRLLDGVEWSEYPK